MPVCFEMLKKTSSSWFCTDGCSIYSLLHRIKDVPFRKTSLQKRQKSLVQRKLCVEQAKESLFFSLKLCFQGKYFAFIVTFADSQGFPHTILLVKYTALCWFSWFTPEWCKKYSHEFWKLCKAKLVLGRQVKYGYQSPTLSISSFNIL